MDFVRYAERAAALVNADAGGAEQLMRLLGDRAWRPDAVAEKDIGAVRRFVSELRPVFEASSSGDARGVVDRLNALLAQHPVTPYISGHGGGGRDQQWHMHVADERSSVAELLAAEALMGLSMLVCDLGATRLGVCSAAPCTDVFVDTSPNRSRRYCSERCSSRANVAAFRARRRVQQAEHRAQASESRAATHD